MNSNLFLYLNGIAGQSALLDAAIVFFAVYFPFGLAAFVVAHTIWHFLRRESAGVNAMFKALTLATAAWLSVQILKFVIAAPRPFIEFPGTHLLFEHGGYDSFPSGHTAFFFALGFALWKHSRFMSVIYLATAFLIGVARVAAGVHWPLDILGGVALAALVVYFLSKLRLQCGGC